MDRGSPERLALNDPLNLRLPSFRFGDHFLLQDSIPHSSDVHPLGVYSPGRDTVEP